MEFKINIDEAVRYMGYRQPPTAQQLGTIREIAGLLEKQLAPAYVFRCFKTENVSGGIRLVGSGVTLRGNSIREHLAGCDSAVLLCATVSSKADELIRAKEAEDIALGWRTSISLGVFRPVTATCLSTFSRALSMRSKRANARASAVPIRLC